MALSTTGPESSTSESTQNISLITKGRRTGKPHTVRLKAVCYSGKFYFSRHHPDSDWYLNAAANSNVTILLGQEYVTGTAKVVSDPELLQLISKLKYPGQGRSKEKRVAIEVVINYNTQSRQPDGHN